MNEKCVDETNQFILSDDGKRTLLSKFMWTIKKDTKIITKNGEMFHFFTISGMNDANEILSDIIVPAAKYEAGGWEHAWGTKAIICNKELYKKYIYTRMKSHEGIESNTLCKFVGKTIFNNEIVYVDHGGMITGTSYDRTIRSDLTARLRYFNLPEPTINEEYLKQCVKACLDLVNLSDVNNYVPFVIILPSMLAILSMFVEVPVSLFLLGRNLVYSDIATLAQSFNGPDFNQKSQLVLDWESGENEIISALTLVNNAAIVVNELNFGDENLKELSKKHDKIMRSVSNKTTYTAAREKATDFQTRGLESVLLTVGNQASKNVPLSTAYRTVYFRFPTKQINQSYLEQCLIRANEGIYAQVASSAIQFHLGKYDRVKCALEKYIQTSRNKAKILFKESNFEVHERCPENLALMMAAIAMLYKFAVAKKVISKALYRELLDGAWDTLSTLMLDQDKIKSDNLNYSGNHWAFIDCLETALENGMAHFLDYKTGKMPDLYKEELLTIGWKNGKPLGKFIGWIDLKNEQVYLSNNISITELKEIIGKSRSKDYPDTEKSFWIMVKHEGGLKTMDKGGNRKKVKDPKTQKWVNARHLDIKLKFFKSTKENMEDDEDPFDDD